MKIELKLHDDQGGFEDDDASTSVWELYVNDGPFPDRINCIVDLKHAHRIVGALLDIEEINRE